MITAVCGTNWGDEGKGRMVDLLSENYDIVVRYQGGNNAGHTVMNGEHTTKFPFGEELEKAQPVYTYMQGWECDISKCRTFSQLPAAARNYVCFIEDEMNYHLPI